jgi:serine/threonine protein kinase
VDPQDISALNGQAESTDDTPTIISRTGPRANAIQQDEPAGGLRGRRLAHFELIEPIGVGGMAAVIRARDTQLDRLVALKILPPDMAKDPDNVQRFHQEARSAARLDHENIARVFFCGEDQSLHFIAFEFVEGENLRAILERRGRLPVAEAIHYILQVAAGLAHASQRGVVHRDIKPSNIIVTPTGRAKLVDMGLARSLERHDRDLTQSGVTLGTFDYISPEQALEPRDADVRSDIYSLGCTFYHVLTGRPPVPEGTAAKKLHHHQHIKPRDPRELVPGLPDEVAIILDRMMAKKPQDRYQSPEQLVHHLLLAARKLGGPSNVPEGVLSVEAALPPPPGGRPLLLAGLAAGLVVLLIVGLEAFNRPPAAQQTAPPVAPGPQSSNNDPGNSAVPAPSAPKDKPAPDKLPDAPPAPRAVAHFDDADGADLLDWLSKTDKDAPKEIVLGNDVNLPPAADVGLLLTGPRVTIQAKFGRRPTIRFTHDSRRQDKDEPPWVAVSIDSPDARVSGVRILVDGRTSNVSMIGIRLHGPSKAAYSVDNCEFIQARPGIGDKRLTSLAVEGDAPADLHLTGCRFLSFTEFDGEVLSNAGAFGGNDAVLRDGPVMVQAVDCAFGPHEAMFRLQGGKGAVAPLLSLDHCSVLAAGSSAVFVVGAGAAVDVSAHACLFSRPAGPTDGAALIRQADAFAEVAYTDSDNRYHGFDVYRAIDGDAGQRSGWSEFRTWAKDGKQPSLVQTDASPWKDDPLAPLRKYNFKDTAAEGHFAAAFQIKESRPDLRLADLGTAPIGVRSLGGVDYVEGLKKADGLADVAKQKRHIVDPTIKESDSKNRIYKTLAEALTGCHPGDEIVLCWDGVQPIEPQRLGVANVQDVTIRPCESHHPQLQLAPGKDHDPEPAMFRVFDGKLALEGLDFVLQAGDESRRQSVIDLIGQGQCSFKNCIITLNRTSNTRLAAVWLADPSKAMMMAPPGPVGTTPQLTLENCFVRGDGDLVACQVSRPLWLEARNTLAALRGSFLSVDTAPGGTAAPSGLMTVTLSKVTTYLTGNLIRLRAGKDKDPAKLTPVHCSPADCLFVAAAKEPQPLILCDDSESNPDLELKDPGRILQWDATHTKVYVNYGTMLDLMPSNPDESMQLSIDMNKWEMNWDNNTGKSPKMFHFVGPTLPPSTDGPLSGAVPLSFKPPPDQPDCGADVDALDHLLSPAK